MLINCLLINIISRGNNLYNISSIGMILAIFLIFIEICFIPCIGSEISIQNSINTLNVGGGGFGNYFSIQDAIDDANPGDTVFVYNGIYYENIVIDKSILLHGESKQNTIIDGMKNNDTVTINAEGATIYNFTITNSSQNDKTKWWKSGIRITKNNNIIRDNIIKDNLLGIFGKQVTNLTICNNIFYNDSVTFYPYDGDGGQDRPIIEEKYFIHNIYNNTINGKKLQYYVNKDNFVISSTVGQIIAVNCTRMVIQNVTLSNADFMILMVFCSNCTIENSHIQNNDGALTLLNSNDNYIRYNTLEDNFHGILLDYNSCNNWIYKNNVSNNLYCGLICEYYSDNNLIQFNNFQKNKKNGYIIHSFLNNWHENYWDNWIGIQYDFLDFLPKIILCSFNNYKLILPINFDWHPVKEPYILRR